MAETKRYHINPKTGNPNVCHASLRCPFGSPEEHFPTKAAALASYENSVAEDKHYASFVQSFEHGFSKAEATKLRLKKEVGGSWESEKSRPQGLGSLLTLAVNEKLPATLSGQEGIEVVDKNDSYYLVREPRTFYALVPRSLVLSEKEYSFLPEAGNEPF